MKIKSKEQITLSETLMKEFQEASRSAVKKIIVHGLVTVNGKKCTVPGTMINPGDEIEYTKFKAGPGSSRSPYPIVFEDDSLIVVEKPAGILTHAEKGATGTSLYKEMLEFVREKSRGKERIYVVHRLDREVSGIVVFVKSEFVQETVKKNWRENTKRYSALVHGTPEKEEGKLETWLVEAKDQKMYPVKQNENAKLAITHYKVKKKMGEVTLLDVELETGRKHQIRAQLAEIGCPVVGDWRYGAKDKVKRRIRLHACYFRMKHPVTGEVLEFTSRMPRGFLTLGEKDEKY